jgi:hypothetical protein
VRDELEKDISLIRFLLGGISLMLTPPQPLDSDPEEKLQ